MKELIAVLLAWISLELGVGPPAPPAVETVSQQQLVELAYGPGAPSDASVTALYRAPIRTVYLNTAWQADSLRDRATLLHELVHHVQEARELPSACLSAREAAAYHLTIKWLRQNGVLDPYAFLNINEFTIAVLSMCIERE
jgi:hypothetical protein